jgi:pimeloyl-ACP methyl ester carboxylesterase
MNERQLYGHGRGGFHRIAYVEWGKASAQPPMICVHGLVGNGRDLDYVASALEGDGRQVFCPDIVGRGKSDWLANPAAQRGPRAELVEFPKIGHAPALMDSTQIAIVAEFLRR